MEKFKNLILIVDDEKYQYDTKEELLQDLLGDKENNYNDMTEEEKEKRRRLKAFINLKGREKYITNYKQESSKKGMFSTDEKFLIDNDDMYVMSLLKMNEVILLEEKNAKIFSAKIDKTDIEDNYLVLNYYAKDIVNNYKAKIDAKIDKMKKNNLNELER